MFFDPLKKLFFINFKDKYNNKLSYIYSPIESIGVYVPGGTASYPSTVLMNCIPAIVAGVNRIVIAVPAVEGFMNPIILACANLLGIKEIYKIGGAQAVAALALGTKRIKNKVYSNGGRVLNFVSLSNNFEESRNKSISLIKNLNWENGFFRKDIGYKVID